MHLIAHAELSWLAAQALPTRRDRILVTVAGLAPDLDALALLGGREAFSTYHHVISHGWVAALVVTAAVASAATSRVRTAFVALLTFHLHLLCDLAGSGPGWPLLYFWPASRHEWYWAGQWNLASWQNSLIAVLAALGCLAMALPFRRTIVEVFSTRADAVLVRALWQRFRPARVRELDPPTTPPATGTPPV
ncbi:MAG: metal-dependent hydrolase [Deltaproteobacteria bacterium]|nr:metal-dependent hydrolase [Deltaproteobacteria bacterium]